MKMTKMIAVLSAIIGSLLIALALSYWIDGYLFKKQYLQLIAFANLKNQQSHSGVSINIDDYRLGLFHSNAVIRVIFTDKDVAQQFPDGITLNTTINHGPIAYDTYSQSYTFSLAAISSDLYLPATVETRLFGKILHKAIVRTYSTISYQGVWYQQIKFLPLTLPQLGNLVIQDSKSQLEYAVNQTQLMSAKINGEIGTISLTNPAQQLALTIQPIAFTQSLQIKSASEWEDNGSLTIPEILMSMNSSVGFDLQQLTFNTKRWVNAQGLASGVIKLNMNRFEVPDNQITLSALSLEVSVLNLDQQALNEYMAYVKQHPSNQLSSEDKNVMIDMISKIVTKSSEVLLNLSFDSSKGSLAVVSKLSMASSSSQPTTPMEALGQLDLNATITMSSTMARLMAETAVSQGGTRFHQQPTDLSENRVVSESQNNSQNELQKEVAALLQQGVITLPQSLEILEYANQSPSVNDFTNKVSSIGNAATTSKLITAYELSHNTSTNLVSTSSKQSASETADALIDQWQSLGYLIKDGDNYKLTIKLHQSIFTLNDKPFSLDNALPQPQPVGVQPSQAPTPSNVINNLPVIKNTGTP